MVHMGSRGGGGDAEGGRGEHFTKQLVATLISLFKRLFWDFKAVPIIARLNCRIRHAINSDLSCQSQCRDSH